jgi:hypothetical protein
MKLKITDMKKYVFLLNTKNLEEYERNLRYVEKTFPSQFQNAKFCANLEELTNYLFVDSSIDIISQNIVYEIIIVNIPKDVEEIAKENVHFTVNAHLHIYKKAD